MSRQIRERINLGLATASLLSAATWLVAFGCSGSGAPKGTSLVDSGGCDPALDADCGSVGASCSVNEDCATGSCASGACISLAPDCPGGDCGPSNGGSGGFDGTFLVDDLDTGGSGGTEATCVDLDVDFARITPTVMLLIDQSGSMDQNFEGGNDRWETLQATLTNPQTSLLKKLDTSVRFGMTLYTSNGGFGNDLDAPKTCPVLRSVDIGLSNFTDMSDMLEGNGPQGDTPTAESVEAIVAELRAFQEDGPKSIILATDGEPDTCEDPDAQNSEARRAVARDRSVAAVRAAYADGIKTHIISVGNEVGVSHLKALAVAGAGEDANAEAYTALDTDALVAAFNAIIGSVRTCDFTLEGTVEADNAARGTVVLDGQSLTFGDPNGWEMPNDQTVRLLGQACEQAQANASGISMKFPCDAIQIIPR